MKNEVIIPKIKYNRTNKIVFENSGLLDIILNNIKLPDELKDEEYKIFSDIKKYDNLQNYEQNKYFNLFSKIMVPISVNLVIVSVGISTESNKIEKMILRNKYKNIIVIIESWENLSSEVQNFIIILLKRKDDFIKQYSKKSITIIYGTTTNNNKIEDYIFDNIVEYSNLSLENSYQLIQKYTHFKDISYRTFSEIYKMNLGNFDNILTTLKFTKEYKYILSKDTLEDLLNNMLVEVDKKIYFKNISNTKVLKLFSLFPKCFDPYEIANIDISIDKFELEKNIEILEKLFVLFKNKTNDSITYTMLLQLKNKLLNSNEGLKREVFKLYYQYLNEFFPLDFKRRIDIQINYLKDEDEILYQYLLLYDYYFTNNMKYNMDFIIKEFENINISKNNKNLFRYITHFKYKESQTLSNKLYYIKNDRIIAFLLKRDIEYYSTNVDANVGLKSLCDILYELIITKKCFENYSLMKGIYIVILIPQYADKFNDSEKTSILIEEFNSIKSRSKTVKGHIEYYKNILNRKSYLFDPTDIAILKCKKVLNFFEDRKDNKEIYMTLNTLLSLYIINNELELAEKCKLEIIKIYDENLPQFYKSKMNFILLDIISGKYTDYNKIISNYTTILNENISETSRSIVFTNLCSLALEYDDFQAYKKFKTEFEVLNNIEDVSDINNEEIDDFYRYYFGWFEFGKNIIQGNKLKAKQIYQDLDNFVPTIYKSESQILSYKHNCFKSVFKSNISHGKEFSEFAFSIKNNYRSWEFLSRGFMLTDIMHTSVI